MDAQSTRSDDSPTQTQVYLGAGLRPGTRLGHYEIQSHIAAGGCGRVYFALDTVLHRPVAIKILLRGHAAGETARKRFALEASATSALNHPNIVTVYEIGRELGPLFGVHHFHHSRHSMEWHQSMKARIGQTLAANMIVLTLGDLTGNVWMEERSRK